MDRRSTDKLRMDRRLVRRKGWITQSELDREIAGLADTSHKIAEADAESDSSNPSATLPKPDRRFATGLDPA